MLYRGLRPKTKVFYSRFRRNVWHPGWGKRGPKMVSLNRPGHAVAPFGGRLFGARSEWFWCDIVGTRWGKRAPKIVSVQRLAPSLGETRSKNPSVEPVWLCCFPVWRPSETRSKNGSIEPAWACCFLVWWPSVWRSA